MTVEKSMDAIEAGETSDGSQIQELQPTVKESTVPTIRFWILSIGVCLGLFLSMIDTSIVATSIYSIGVEFQDVQRVNWVALAYTLSYLGCAVTFSRISDITGRRKAFTAAYVVFFAFSLGCGFSQSLNQLIACRALQGIGGSGLYSLSMIMLPDLCPQHLRQYMGSLVGLVVAGSGVLGPVLGGILTQYSTWRWIFWINGPIGLVSLLIFCLAWPKSQDLPSVTKRTWKEFDYIGSLIVMVASILVVFAFQFAGESTHPIWENALFIAPLVIGLVLWMILVAWGRLARYVYADKGIALTFPIALFGNRAYAAAAISTLFLGYPYFITNYAFPLRVQVVDQKTPLMAGIMLLPMLGSTAVGSILAGVFSRTKNYLLETMLAGACLMTMGVGLLTTIHGSQDDAKALGFLVFAGLGFGLSVASATILTSLEVPIADFAPAQGIIAQLRILGGSLGIATSTILLSSKTSQLLSGILTPDELATLGHGDSLSSAQRNIVHRAFSEAFHNDMVAATAVSGVAILVVLIGYRRGSLLVADQREARIREEMSRRSRQFKD